MHYTQIIIILFYLSVIVLSAKSIFKEGKMPSFGGILFFILLSWGVIKLLTLNVYMLEDILRYTLYAGILVILAGIIGVIFDKKSNNKAESKL